MRDNKGFSILQTLVITSLLGVVSYFVSSQNNYLINLIRGTDISYDVEQLQLRLKRSLKNPYACNATLNQIKPLLDSILAPPYGDKRRLELDLNTYIFEAKDSSTIPVQDYKLMDLKENKKAQLDYAFIENSTADSFDVVIRYRKIGKIVGPEAVVRRLTILTSKLSNSGNYECLGVNDGNAIKDLQAICHSLGGEYLADGRCIGVVTYDSLRDFCESVDGDYEYSTGLCLNKPGLKETSSFCQNLGGTPTGDGRNCTEIPYDLRREELCISLGGDYSIETGCRGVAEYYLKKSCESLQGIFSVDANGIGVCTGALSFNFKSLCESLDGNFVNNKCENPMNLNQRFQKLCSSVGGTYESENCVGVSDNLYTGFCSTIGGNYDTEKKGCYDFEKWKLEKYCQTINGSYSNTGVCSNMYATFIDTCEVFDGEFSSEQKDCTEADAGMLKMLCNRFTASDGETSLYEFIDGKCEPKFQQECPNGQIRIGKTCANLTDYLANNFNDLNVSMKCPEGTFAKGVNDNLTLNCQTIEMPNFLDEAL
jgi:hypothetical protein